MGNINNIKSAQINPQYNYFIEKISPYITFDDVKCVFDIGSRDAIESICFENTFQNARIYTFEPNPMQYIVCQENIRTALTDRVSLVQLALANMEGKVDFFVTPGNIGASSMLRPQFVPWTANQNFMKIDVNCTKLDNFCKKTNVKPDIIWMDVQGNELNVLLGGQETLENVKVICTEAGLIPYYDGHTLKDDIVQYLKTYGFEILDDKMDWSHETNIIFIKNNLSRK